MLFPKIVNNCLYNFVIGKTFWLWSKKKRNYIIINLKKNNWWNNNIKKYLNCILICQTTKKNVANLLLKMFLIFLWFLFLNEFFARSYILKYLINIFWKFELGLFAILFWLIHKSNILQKLSSRIILIEFPPMFLCTTVLCTIFHFWENESI